MPRRRIRITAGHIASRGRVREAYERLYSIAAHGGRPDPADIKLTRDAGVLTDDEYEVITAMKSYPELD